MTSKPTTSTIARDACRAQDRAKPLAPGLYVVATPIGNLGDISLRALDILAAADAIACEDTRVTAKLLTRYGIETPRFSYHDHNAARVRPKILRQLEGGASIALVSDAGTPTISDPGYRLVREAAESGLAVLAVPGPSAMLAALMISGLPTDRFLFAGFLPAKAGGRRQALIGLKAIDATLVFFESPRRLAKALADMADTLGPREACVTREMTKLHEESRRGSLGQLAAQYGVETAPKGEAVIVVGPPAKEATDWAAVDEVLVAAMAAKSLSDSVSMVARVAGLPRQKVYGRALELSKKGGDQ